MYFVRFAGKLSIIPTGDWGRLSSLCQCRARSEHSPALGEGRVPGSRWEERSQGGPGLARATGLRGTRVSAQAPPEAAAWSLAPSRSQPLFSVVPGHKPRGVAEPGLMTRLRRPRSGRTSSSPTEKAAPRARNSKQRPGRFSSRRSRQPHGTPRRRAHARAPSRLAKAVGGAAGCGAGGAAGAWPAGRVRGQQGGCVASRAGAATSICVPASATSSITASAPSAHMSPSAARRRPGVAAKRVLTTQVP